MSYIEDKVTQLSGIADFPYNTNEDIKRFIAEIIMDAEHDSDVRKEAWDFFGPDFALDNAQQILKDD